jgi:hypothetical protein
VRFGFERLVVFCRDALMALGALPEHGEVTAR